jgi:spore germination protein GerM
VRRWRRRSTTPAFGLVAALILGLAGCGVGAQERAHPIDQAAEGWSAVTSPTPPAIQSGPIVERIYLVRDDMLVPVERRVPQPPTIEALLRDLVAGPTEAESQAGFSSPLLGTDIIANATVSNGQATVELVVDAIGDTGRTDDILQLGQIVCTLTSRNEITWVQFTRDGKPITVPRGDAERTDSPLTAADYSGVIGPSGDQPDYSGVTGPGG